MMGPQEDYIETVFTCEGDYNDPHLQDRLEDFQKSLKDLLLTDKNKLILKKVEPWNSVRVTFNIPREAAVRLKQLAQQRNETLRDLGVLAVQIQNQHISLTIAGRNNERTQLVFCTADTSAATTPTVSVFDTNSPSLDQLGPQGPGPSNIEATSKKISDYLRQNSAIKPIIGTLLNNQPSQHDKVFPTSTAVDVGKGKVNNIYAPFSEHGAGYQHPQPHPSHNNPASSSSTAPSPSRSPVPGQKVNTPVSAMPAGLPPGLPPGPRHPSLDNLPPPPPYPQGSSFMNNLRFGNPGASPLLVNLLQNDPNFSNFLASGRLPGPVNSDSLPPPVKKKRKPAKKKKAAEGTVPVKTSLQNPALSPGHSGDSLPATSLPSSTSTTTSFVNHGLNPSVREHAFHNPQAMHNTNMQVPSEQSVPLTCPLVQRRSDESDTAGKIINPVTGVLEPMEIASDISPAKSDSSTGKQHSPRSLAQRVTSKVETKGDILDKKDKSVDGGRQGKPVGENQSVTLQPSDHSSIHVMPPRLPDSELSGSSHFSVNAPASAMSQHQKSIQGVMKNDLLVKGHLKNNIKVEQKMKVTLPECHSNKVVESGKPCDRLTEIESNSSVNSDRVAKREVIPQESEEKSIPCQLLNKPLLQVKHNSSAGKPSGSPDSNGDSECSTQSLNLDTHNGSHSDPRAYNNDSGVGSCSERSDDTPSEPGDNDYKSGHSSSFECAKTQVLTIETAKQTVPSSKVMTVGYTVSDTPKDIKNHQIVSSYSGMERLNSSYDSVKLKSEKLAVCSTSQSQVVDWSTKEHLSVANNVELLKNAVCDRNAKSPKLSVSLATSLSHGLDGQHHPMQGNSEVSMQKKKSSPRNSPRGSPRNAGSPRHPGSPRGASPRTSEPSPASQRPPFLTAHDYTGGSHSSESHKSVYSESGRSPHSEQRKSPFSMMLTSHQGTSITNKTNISGAGGLENVRLDFHHSVGGNVGVDSLRIASQQCNMDSIALLKSLEANPHLSQLSAIAANKDPSLYQKLEELRPLFQKLQQQQQQFSTAQAGSQLVTPVNGVENFNHSSRSPLGPQSSLSKPPPVSFVNSAFDNVPLPNNIHPLSVSDRENINVNNHSTKSNKVTIEETKGANGNSCKRSSPGAATSSSASYVQGYDSSLPPPKRLTESVQKLFPLPLDNHLPHENIRSPSNSASTTRPSASSTISPPSSRTAITSAGHRISASDAHSFEVDSIIPSFIGFSPELPSSLAKGSNSVSISDSANLPLLPVSEPLCVTQSQGNYQLSTSVLTRSVPVLTGSIPSHRAVETISCVNTTHSPVITCGPSITLVSSVATPTTGLRTVMCNSDSKMASSTIESATLKAPLSSTGYSAPVSHSTVRYPVAAQSEKPKNSYQQMGLSEMLLETARSQMSQNLIPGSTESLTVSSSQTHHTTVRTSSKLTVPHEQESACNDTPTDTLRTGHVLKPVPSSSSNNNNSNVIVNSSLSSRTVVSSHASRLLSQEVKASNSEYSDSDIPKLTRQTNLASLENGPVQTIPEPMSTGKLNEFSKCYSDISQTEVDAASSVLNNANPPVLTAVPDLLRTKSQADPRTGKKEDGHGIVQGGRPEVLATVQKVPAVEREVTTRSSVDLPQLAKHSLENETPVSITTSIRDVSVSRPVSVTNPVLASRPVSTVGSVSATGSMSVSGPALVTSEPGSTTGPVLGSGPVSVSVTASVSVSSTGPVSAGVAVINNPAGEHVLHNYYHEVESSDPSSAKTSKVIKKSQGTSESVEDKGEDSDVLPRQLRSRKRNNTGESDAAGSADDSKKLKLDPNSEVVHKLDTPSKEMKATGNVRTLVSHNTAAGTEHKEDENIHSDSIKSGLRTRTNLKNVSNDDKETKGKVAVTRDLKKEARVVSNKSVVEKKSEPAKVEDKKVPNRRNRQSPSAPTTDKQAAAVVTRDKSPLRGRTRGRNSPVVTDNTEESQENKRTTRSAKTKGEPASAVPGKAVAANKRRRTSQDHR